MPETKPPSLPVHEFSSRVALPLNDFSSRKAFKSGYEPEADTPRTARVLFADEQPFEARQLEILDGETVQNKFRTQDFKLQNARDLVSRLQSKAHCSELPSLLRVKQQR